MAFVLMLQSSMNFVVLCFSFCHDVIRSYNFHAGKVDTVVRVPEVEAHVVSGRQGVWPVFAPQALVWLATALLEENQHMAFDQAFESHTMRRNPPCWGSNGECPIALRVNLKRLTVWTRRPFVFKRQWVLSFPFYVLLRTKMIDPAQDQEIFLAMRRCYIKQGIAGPFRGCHPVLS